MTILTRLHRPIARAADALCKRLALSAEELAPAFRVDRAVDDLAGIRRLELDAAVAFLRTVRMLLILGVGLADLGLRRGARGCSRDRGCADGHGRPGDHYAP
jgi:hypothetical protein